MSWPARMENQARKLNKSELLSLHLQALENHFEESERQHVESVESHEQAFGIVDVDRHLVERQAVGYCPDDDIAIEEEHELGPVEGHMVVFVDPVFHQIHVVAHDGHHQQQSQHQTADAGDRVNRDV